MTPLFLFWRSLKTKILSEFNPMAILSEKRFEKVKVIERRRDCNL